MLKAVLGWVVVVCGVFSSLLVVPTARADDPVAISAAISKPAVRGGDQFAIAVIINHEPKWHVHTNDPKPPASWGEFLAIPTKISLQLPAGLRAGAIQWPKGKALMLDLGGTGKPEPYEVFDGRAVAFVPVVAGPEFAGGAAEISIDVSYQACDDKTCQMPTSQQVTVAINSGGATTDATLFEPFDMTSFARMDSGEVGKESVKPVRFPIFGYEFSVDPSGAVGVTVLLLLAGLGGFLLNLTPCVLPVIPLKVMSLSQIAGNPARCLFLGVVMSLGVVAFWLGIGLAISFVAGFGAINQLFQTSWFGLGVGVFIAIMALGMLGLFTIALPQKVYLAEVDRGSVPGSFGFGILTAVLSTPCTAPFMGSAAAWATKQPTATTLATFSAIGAGMAMPYLVLAAFPKLVAWVPRTGAWSELVKQVMGLLMLAVAAFFVGTGLDPWLREPIDPALRAHWWFVAGFVVVAMAWLVVRVWQLRAGTIGKLLWTAVAVVFAGANVMVASTLTDRGPIAWVGYTPARFAEATAAGKVIVLDFTAEWCLNCKALESGVLHRAEVVNAIAQSHVVAMRVDLTGSNPDGQAKLKELNWVGIPLLAISGPGAQEPIKFDTYTPQSVLDAISNAKGK
jgi:suppressor for copper-sensitivity B